MQTPSCFFVWIKGGKVRLVQSDCGLHEDRDNPQMQLSSHSSYYLIHQSSDKSKVSGVLSCC